MLSHLKTMLVYSEH